MKWSIDRCTTQAAIFLAVYSALQREVSASPHKKGAATTSPLEHSQNSDARELNSIARVFA